MDTKQVNLYVFDERTNFEKSKRFLGEDGVNFNRIVCVESRSDFEKELDRLSENEYVFLVVHVFHTSEIKGVKAFEASGIRSKYPRAGNVYISEGTSKVIIHDLVDQDLEATVPVWKYHQINTKITKEDQLIFTKGEILRDDLPLSSSDHKVEKESLYPQIDYAIITALYDDEFEQLKSIIHFEDKHVLNTNTISYRIGHQKSNPSRRIVAAVPSNTGMVDSAIIATQMLDFFKPKYLLMSGVCGGAEDLNFGDIVVAKQIFTFQKGKISDLVRKDEEGKPNLFNAKGDPVDYDKLFDDRGDLISISIEKFEREMEAAINLDSLVEGSLRHCKTNIENSINVKLQNTTFLSPTPRVKIHIEPIACSTMVINKKGYFEDTIRAINRKTAAVEMESYGVARAAQIANDGKTKAIIFKSVMDKTHKKQDTVNGFDYKQFAAYTSALFLEELFNEGVI